jgi:hypothetical protein
VRRGLLQRAPEQSELERLYRELALAGAPAVGRDRPWPYRPCSTEELIALAGEMLRHDPRLLSILLQWVLEHWPELNPLELRGQMRRMRWPQALCVVLEFARRASAEPELRYLANYVSAGWPRIDPPQRFFFDAERPGSRIAARKLSRNLEAYSRWGFVGSERPVADVDTKRTVGRYDAKIRHRILDRLIENRGELTMAEYLEAVDHTISRQQAHADLAAHPELEVKGHGRSARWRKA